MAIDKPVPGADEAWEAEAWRDKGIFDAVRDGRPLSSPQRDRIMEWWMRAKLHDARERGLDELRDAAREVLAVYDGLDDWSTSMERLRAALSTPLPLPGEDQ